MMGIGTGRLALRGRALLILAVAVLVVMGHRAHAQVQIRQPPTVLTDVSVADGNARETTVILTFAPVAPNFSVIRDETDRPSIGFALSSRGSSARAPGAFHGLLRAIGFDQSDSILVVNLATGGPVRVAGAPISNQAIKFTLTRVGSGAQTSDRNGAPASGAGPAPHAAEPTPGADGFVLVPLKYADVSEVVGLLTDGLGIKPNDSFTPREPAFGSAGMGGSGGGFSPALPPNPDQGNEPLGQTVDDAIGVDRRLNAIILKGTPERIARLRARIAEIDLPVDSVVLETIFVELTESAARNVGLDANNANSQIAVTTFQTGAFIPPGFPIKGGLSSASLQAAIYAQVREGRGRIVSKPRISAQSGSSAKIITGDALPILTAITLSGVNGVSQQVQYVNVGVTLQIAPRVSSDGFVTSHVFCVVSSVTGFSQGYPTISQREAQTSATVRDGETFVIGGLTEENEISSTDKIPGLGDLPFAGGLFRLHKGTQSKTDLYIVVTPHIIRRADAAEAAVLRDEAGPRPEASR